MTNPLNLKKATFTRINQHGVEETVTMSVRTLIADYKTYTATVIFEAFANEDAPPIIHNLTIPMVVTNEEHQQAIALCSGLIWVNGGELPFIDNFESIDGKWMAVKKSLVDLDAQIEDVDLADLIEKSGKK